MLRLTMHFSLRHFVLKRSMAFWFLSENLEIEIQSNFCNPPRVKINLRVSLSHRNSSRSRRGQNFARLLKDQWITQSWSPFTCQSCGRRGSWWWWPRPSPSPKHWTGAHLISVVQLGPKLQSKSWPKAEHYIHCVIHHHHPPTANFFKGSRPSRRLRRHQT